MLETTLIIIALATIAGFCLHGLYKGIRFREIKIYKRFRGDFRIKGLALLVYLAILTSGMACATLLLVFVLAEKFSLSIPLAGGYDNEFIFIFLVTVLGFVLYHAFQPGGVPVESQKKVASDTQRKALKAISDAAQWHDPPADIAGAVYRVIRKYDLEIDDDSIQEYLESACKSTFGPEAGAEKFWEVSEQLWRIAQTQKK